ncbi:MAG: efflux RND transporter periplasmic adaptor subunit, partial [Rhodocyclaceae bacterium]
MNRRHWIIAAAVAALAAGGTGWLLRHNAKPPAAATAKAPADRVKLAADAPQLAFLKVEEAVEGPLPAAGPFNGRLTLADDLTARVYPPVSGRVVRLAANLGDKVDKGGLLAVLDAPDFGAALADVKKAEADAALKGHALQRAQTLYQGEAIARRDLEAAEADAAASRAESERARLRLANLAPGNAKLEGEHLQLRSPVAGIVVDRQANPGTEVRADGANPLFVVSDISRLWLSLDLPEQEKGVHTGDMVQFSVDSWPGEQFGARVDRVSPVLDPATRRIPVRVVVDNRNGRLRPEMYARAVV